MAILVKRLGFKRKKGKLYHIDFYGNLAETRPGSHKKRIVALTGIRKQSGYLYYLDKQGNISRSKMNRRGRKPN